MNLAELLLLNFCCVTHLRQQFYLACELSVVSGEYFTHNSPFTTHFKRTTAGKRSVTSLPAAIVKFIYAE